MSYELRPYQRATVDAIWAYFAEHSGNPLAVLPTAAGKSIVQAAFIKSVLDSFPTQRFLCLTHVKELVSQNAEKLTALLPANTVGVYSAGLKRREVSRPVTVASIQSLAARLRDLPSADLVIIDEAHLVPPDGEGRYRTVLSSLRALNPAVKVIGMSATPYRLKSGWLHKGKGRLFTDIAHEVGIRELIEAGYLCPLRSKSGRSEADLSQVHTRGGEYVAGEAEDAMLAGDLVERSVDEICAHAANRNKWLVFTSGLTHAARVNEELGRRGVTSKVVSGDMPVKERDGVLDAFRQGSLRAVVNVNVLTTGYDAPDVDCVVLMRATKSPGLYVQMVGRAMRLHPSKSDALILDFGGNVLRHGPVDAIEIRERETGGGRAPQKVCPACRETCPASARQCACGFTFDVLPTAPHETQATALPVLSEDAEIAVDDVRYALHRKVDKPDSMRVEYRVGMTYYREWVCFEHTGFAREKAARWWARRAGVPVPETTLDALRRVSELRRPSVIKVRRDGQYWSVVGASFERLGDCSSDAGPPTIAKPLERRIAGG